MPNLPKPRLRRTDRSVELTAAPPAAPTEPNVDIVQGEGLRWINIESPTDLEWGWMREQFDFHTLDLEDVLSRNQRPKIDEYPDYLFIVLHLPVFDRSVGRLNVGELDMFVGPDFVVTIPNQPLQPVEYLFERCRANEETREKVFTRGSGYLLYRIVDDSFDYCFPMLRKIGNKLDAIEDDIFEEERSDEVVRDISRVKQEIINFRKVIRPQRPVLRDLENVKQRFLAPDLDLEIYFDDIVDAHERIWDMLENYKEVVEALEETNESVLNHRVNEILRVLTAISVMVLPLTLIASIWGMNVGVPGEGDEFDFYIVLGGMVVVLVGMLGLLPQARLAVSGSLRSVNVARARLILLNGQPAKTGIFKEPVDGPVAIGAEGLEGDRVVDREVHGGIDKAVYAYGTGDYAWWSEELGRECGPGLFGENLTVDGIDPSTAEIGERWRVGSTVLEVSEPRTPCSKLAAKMEDGRFVKRFARALRLGAYLRVIEPGQVRAGDPVEVVAQPGHGVTTELVGRVIFGERSLAPRVLEASALGDSWRDWLRSRDAAAG